MPAAIVASFLLSIIFPIVGVPLAAWSLASAFFHLTGDVDRWNHAQRETARWAEINRGSNTYGGRIVQNGPTQ